MVWATLPKVFSQTFGKFCSQNGKFAELYFFDSSKFVEMLVWTRRMRLWQTHCFVFRQKAERFYPESRKTITKLDFLQTWFLRRIGFPDTWNAFLLPCQLFLQKISKFCLKYKLNQNWKKIIKIIPWTCTMQFSQPLQNFPPTIRNLILLRVQC